VPHRNHRNRTNQTNPNPSGSKTQTQTQTQQIPHTRLSTTCSLIIAARHRSLPSNPLSTHLLRSENHHPFPSSSHPILTVAHIGRRLLLLSALPHRIAPARSVAAHLIFARAPYRNKLTHRRCWFLRITTGSTQSFPPNTDPVATRIYSALGAFFSSLWW